MDYSLTYYSYSMTSFSKQDLSLLRISWLAVDAAVEFVHHLVFKLDSPSMMKTTF